MSRNVVVSYRTRDDAAEENARLVGEVFTALADAAPGEFRYATYRLADGVGFVHVARFEGPANPLATLPEFAEFQRELARRYVEQPTASEATVVGSYAPGGAERARTEGTSDSDH